MRLDGATCIVTGANSGIGLEVTAGLRQQGAHVIMACRDLGRCEAARAQLDALQLPGSCCCSCLDLSDYGSVREFVARVDADPAMATDKLRVLVNNAGVMGVGRGEDGEDMHLRTNHLGPFLLTRLLLPQMAGGARVVSVASRAHQQGSLAVRDGHILDTPSTWYRQYARSKLCNILFTAELQRRLKACGAHVTAYAVHPGLVDTPLVHRPSLRDPLSWPFRLAAGRLTLTPREGAKSTLHAATSPEVGGRDALYLVPQCSFLWAGDVVEGRTSPLARDPDLATRLWEASEAATRMTQQERATLV